MKNILDFHSEHALFAAGITKGMSNICMTLDQLAMINPLPRTHKQTSVRDLPSSPANMKEPISIGMNNGRVEINDGTHRVSKFLASGMRGDTSIPIDATPNFIDQGGLKALRKQLAESVYRTKISRTAPMHTKGHTMLPERWTKLQIGDQFLVDERHFEVVPHNKDEDPYHWSNNPSMSTLRHRCYGKEVGTDRIANIELWDYDGWNLDVEVFFYDTDEKFVGRFTELKQRREPEDYFLVDKAKNFFWSESVKKFISLFESKLLSGAANDKFYSLIVNKLECGPFDGGCVTVAKALAEAIGGSVNVLIREDTGKADHAFVIMPDGRCVDYDGFAPDVPTFINRFKQNEHLKHNYSEVREYRESDLPYAPVDEHLIEELAQLFKLELL